MMSRTYWIAFLLALIGLAPWVGVQAQSGTPVIRSFTVDQVPELVPGTELVFRVGGSAGGSLQLDIDGVASPLGLTETSAGMYAGAYTISIRDKVRHDSRVLATLRLDGRQTTVALSQTLLTAEAHARASAPAPVPVQISRIETRNTGALTGGHVISFIVDATPGGLAMVSLDGGKSTIPLTEERTGRYIGRYTVKTRDQFSDATLAQFSLVLADKTMRAAKPLGSGAVTPVAQAAPVEPAPAPACDGCGVVVSVNTVKVKGKPNYVGAIAGGVAGAALGNQVGKGDGRTLATVLGAVGGAVAGREVEKQVRSDTRYDLTVKLDNGTTRVVSYDANPGLAVGTKVRFDGELLRVRD
ncbi:MAG: glycine zipper 2TM domain-containing protein [Burkholderiaceae bacterium]|nr:glycine zipper 2TM domain-containing protein [Rhodoferax sp.]MCB2008572.1 glycine zipper 2TM domain-containing protein [Rhodoferax sp.]MCB2030268.1 glycine zipper 2TM domain-containing protein [Rhodoferax sp.]MCP5261079.1 glycine zipper 2TM domain-containing protein [Rhodoferax sp.]